MSYIHPRGFFFFVTGPFFFRKAIRFVRKGAGWVGFFCIAAFEADGVFFFPLGVIRQRMERRPTASIDPRCSSCVSIGARKQLIPRPNDLELLRNWP